MRLVTYNPFQINRWVNTLDTIHDTQAPSVNIVEKDNGFYLDLVSPGMAKEDFKIELKEKQLTISAEKKNESEVKEDGKVWRNEFSFSSFKRSFYLPDTAEGNAIEAAYDQGILKVFIPKKAVAVPEIKTIEVA